MLLDNFKSAYWDSCNLQESVTVKSGHVLYNFVDIF